MRLFEYDGSKDALGENGHDADFCITAVEREDVFDHVVSNFLLWEWVANKDIGEPFFFWKRIGDVRKCKILALLCDDNKISTGLQRYGCIEDGELIEAVLRVKTNTPRRGPHIGVSSLPPIYEEE